MRRYRGRAARYDTWTAAGQAYRDATVRRLELTPGAVVLDIWCGTGLNFAALEDQIGPRGRVIGIDVSPEMLAEAHARTERRLRTRVREQMAGRSVRARPHGGYLETLALALASSLPS